MADADAARAAEEQVRSAERAVAEQLALAGVAGAARGLDSLFGGSPRAWTLDGRRVSEPAAEALLVLHDCLNDLRQVREGNPDAIRYVRETAAGVPGASRDQG